MCIYDDIKKFKELTNNSTNLHHLITMNGKKLRTRFKNKIFNEFHLFLKTNGTKISSTILKLRIACDKSKHNLKIVKKAFENKASINRKDKVYAWTKYIILSAKLWSKIAVNHLLIAMFTLPSFIIALYPNGLAANLFSHYLTTPMWGYLTFVGHFFMTWDFIKIKINKPKLA